MKQENLNNPNREFQSLQKSFDRWDAGTPSSDVWENLEADLAVSAVWDRLDESLELEGSPADKALVDSYENWSPNSSGDGWSKLDEQLSRERVWTRLNTTLNYPVSTRIPWVKMAAASVIFMFLAFYTDRFTPSNDVQRNQLELISGDVTAETKERQLASTNETEATLNETPDGVQNSTLANNALATPKERVQKYMPVYTPGQVNLGVTPGGNQNGQMAQHAELNPDQHLAQDNRIENNPATSQTAETSISTRMEDLAALDPLGRKEFRVEPGTIGDFHFLPFNVPFRPHFSVLVGGQFSLINEKNRTAFSSSLPSMGIAADFQYHMYSGRLRFTQDLGFSQYAQSNGSYINGRYTSSNQKLNTIHFMSSVGYTFRRGVTVYGGIALNRLLNGYEASRTTITNVYNSNKLQLGATAGIDYHFAPFSNKTALGVGMQYQFVSRLKSGNAVFDDIQGVKLQIKYSF